MKKRKTNESDRSQMSMKPSLRVRKKTAGLVGLHVPPVSITPATLPSSSGEETPLGGGGKKK